MKLLESTQKNITEDKTGKNVEITGVILVHYNIVNNDYQQDSRVLSTFVSNKLFGWLLEVSSTNFIFVKTFNSESLVIK